VGSTGAHDDVGNRTLFLERPANRNLRGVHIVRHWAVAFRESQRHLAAASFLGGDDRWIGSSLFTENV